MRTSELITQFIEAAKSRGASDETVVGLLKSRGWSEKEVYSALGSHYQKLTGLETPPRAGSGTAARDAFFYLLVFATLATWTFSLGALAFDLIDRWLADSLFQNAWQSTAASYGITSEIAAILVSFPIYLLISRIVVGDASKHPDKLNSPVRKWLTYMALVIAAGVFIGDLINALTYLLRGSLTSQFLAKSTVVFILSGGVFLYYFGGLKKSDEPEEGHSWNRERWMGAISTIAVVTMIVLGFMNTGAPKQQRRIRADAKRLQNLYELSVAIKEKWNEPGQKLPSTLEELKRPLPKDPETQKPFEYIARSEKKYALCAEFQLDSGQADAGATTMWTHPAGHYCFEIDPSKDLQMPANYNLYN